MEFSLFFALAVAVVHNDFALLLVLLWLSLWCCSNHKEANKVHKDSCQTFVVVVCVLVVVVLCAFCCLFKLYAALPPVANVYCSYYSTAVIVISGKYIIVVVLIVSVAVVVIVVCRHYYNNGCFCCCYCSCYYILLGFSCFEAFVGYVGMHVCVLALKFAILYTYSYYCCCGA